MRLQFNCLLPCAGEQNQTEIVYLKQNVRCRSGHFLMHEMHISEVQRHILWLFFGGGGVLGSHNESRLS